MISLKINNLKNFTSHLLVKDTFNKWQLVEGTIATHSVFQINGRINSDFFTADDLNEFPDKYNHWSSLRPICYEIIKGNSLPTYFKFVFRLDVIDEDSVDGQFVNVKYENGVLNVTTGISMKIFTPDKSAEKQFDSYITQFFIDNSIDFSIN